MAKMSGKSKGGKTSGTGRSHSSFDQKLNTNKGIGLDSKLEKAATNTYKGYAPSVSSDPLVGSGGSSGGSAETYSK